MFEQLDDDYFDSFYKRKENELGGKHNIIDIAAISLSANNIEKKSNLIFYRENADGLIFDKAVIGFEGKECFLLNCQQSSQLISETYIQCSSITNSSYFSSILKLVLSELNLDFFQVSWINQKISY